MADLVAQGPEAEQRWRHTLPAGSVTLGRMEKCDWEIPWDERISRRHATVTWKDGKLHVRKEPDARNDIFYLGQKVQECTLGIGEHFVIGRTKFFIEEGELTPAGDMTPSTGDSPSPVAELTCSPQELQAVRYGDASDRLEVLSHLPAMIRFSPSDEEFEKRVVGVLLDGIARASAAAVMWMDPTGPSEIKVSAQTQRGGGAGHLKPSRRLVFEAIRRRRQPVMHSWGSGQSGDFTASAGFDWAICAPLPDDPLPGWALYITGQITQALPQSERSIDNVKKEDLKFAGLVADIFGALRQVRDLQKRKSILESFMSPTVLAAVANQDMDKVLRPRQTNVTVLFCDLRGFSRIVENEVLEDICERVSEALGIMTRHIFDKDGVISDFQGDAAMGFWGWPFETDNQVEQAARAALAIRKEFFQAGLHRDHPLANFACGIGLAYGPAIAGRLGTIDQFKVGVFGPVVNLASRLESLTKFFRVPVLVDENVAQRLGGEAGGKIRLRRLARIQPYGMSKTLMLSELMPPRHEPGAMSEHDRRDYEAALDNFMTGRWDDAQQLLELLPNDGPSQVLRETMKRLQGKAPANWDGVIVMASK